MLGLSLLMYLLPSHAYNKNLELALTQPLYCGRCCSLWLISPERVKKKQQYMDKANPIYNTVVLTTHHSKA